MAGSDKDIGEVLNDGHAIEEAVRRAFRSAVLDHKRVGNPIATWRDGRVIWIPPEEIEVPPEE